MHAFLNAQYNVSDLVETASDVLFVFDFTTGPAAAVTNTVSP